MKTCFAKQNKEKVFAVKILRNDDDEYREQAKKEYELMRDVKHPNITRMYQLFFNEARNSLYFVMELN